MANERGLGWLPDVPKVSDYGPEHEQVAPLLKLTKGAVRTAQAGAPSAPAAQIDLRQWFSPIEAQGDLGSCTANAAVGLVEYFERRAKGT